MQTPGNSGNIRRPSISGSPRPDGHPEAPSAGRMNSGRQISWLKNPILYFKQWLTGTPYSAQTQGYTSGLTERTATETPQTSPEMRARLEAASSKAKAEAAKQKETNFASPQAALKRTRAREIAKILISENGTLPDDLGAAVASIKAQIPSSSSKSADAQIRSTLDKLTNSPELRQILESIGTPSSQDNPANNLIRNTLGLPADAEITPAHARQAALACILDDPRQGRLGSCFTTALAINLTANTPEVVLQDLKDLIEHGSFNRGDIAYNLSNSYTCDALNATLHLGPQYTGGGTAIGSKRGTVTGDKIHTIPALQLCFEQLGITDPEDQKTAVLDALKNLRELNPGKKRSLLQRLTFRHNTSSVKVSNLLEQIALKQANLRPDTFQLKNQLDALSQEIRKLNESTFPDDTLINEKIDEYEQIQDILLENTQALENAQKTLQQLKNTVINDTSNPLLLAWTYTMGNTGESRIPQENFVNRLFTQRTLNQPPLKKSISVELAKLLEKAGGEHLRELFTPQFDYQLEKHINQHIEFIRIDGRLTPYSKETGEPISEKDLSNFIADAIPTVLGGPLQNSIATFQPATQEALQKAMEKLQTYAQKSSNTLEWASEFMDKNQPLGIKAKFNELANKELGRAERNSPQGLFRRNFSEKLKALINERIDFKYVGGNYVVVDKTGAANPKFGSEMTPGEAIQEVISNLTLEAYANYREELNITDPEVNNQLRNIVETLRNHIKSEDFLLNYALSRNPEMNVQSPAGKNRAGYTGALNEVIQNSLDGGHANIVVPAYLNKAVEANYIYTAQTPKDLAENMIFGALAMMQDPTNSLHESSNPNARIYVSNNLHAFNILPNQGLMKEALDAIRAMNEAQPMNEEATREAIKDWLANNMEGRTMVFADTNWNSEGQHIQFAIRAKKGKLLLIKIDENGKDLGGTDNLGNTTETMTDDWLGDWKMVPVQTSDLTNIKA